MQERLARFVLCGITALMLVIALSRQSTLVKERNASGIREKGLSEQVGKLQGTIAETEKQRQAVTQKATEAAGELEKVKGEAAKQQEAATKKIAELSQELEKLRPPPPAPPEPPPDPMKVRLDALEKEMAAKESSIQEGIKSLQAKLDEIVKGKDSAAGAQQIADLTAKAKGIEASVAKLGEALTKTGTQTQSLLQKVEAMDGRLLAQEQLVTTEKQRRDLEMKVHRETIDSLRRLLSELARSGTEMPADSLEPEAPGAGAEAVEPSAGKPAVDTTIKASTESVVVLAAGKKNGVVLGQILYVTRGGAPVGRVRIINVYDNLAGAAILDTVGGETIQKEDRVTTEPPPGVVFPLSEPKKSNAPSVPTTETAPPPPPAATQPPPARPPVAPAEKPSTPPPPEAEAPSSTPKPAPAPAAAPAGEGGATKPVEAVPPPPPAKTEPAKPAEAVPPPPPAPPKQEPAKPAEAVPPPPPAPSK